MKFILFTLGFFVWPFLLTALIMSIGITIFCFVTGDFNSTNYTYFIDLFSPFKHMWVRGLYVVWLIVCIAATYEVECI